MGFIIHSVNSEVSLCKEGSVQDAGGLMVSKRHVFGIHGADALAGETGTKHTTILLQLR